MVGCITRELSMHIWMEGPSSVTSSSPDSVLCMGGRLQPSGMGWKEAPLEEQGLEAAVGEVWRAHGLCKTHTQCRT